jgi:hypothetical protein
MPEALLAERAWVKNVGRKFEVGMKFHDVSPGLRKFIASLAAMHRFRRAI